ncbi:MAG TPA: hypothetical protein EYP63_08960 [Desulfotomaculum sp.]|nr:hypothetical protein [Desulfotomaculum sp.]
MSRTASFYPLKERFRLAAGPGSRLNRRRYRLRGPAAPSRGRDFTRCDDTANRLPGELDNTAGSPPCKLGTPNFTGLKNCGHRPR